MSMKNQTTAKGIVVTLAFLSGILVSWWFFPEKVIITKEVPVEVIKEVYPTEKDIYGYCNSVMRATFYSNWNGKLNNDNISPKELQDFIDDCFTKLTAKPQ